MDVAYLRNRKWLPVIALVLMVAALWIGMNGRGQRVWENLQNSRLQFPSGLKRSGDAYGVMNSGPTLSVGGGRYTIRWDTGTRTGCSPSPLRCWRLRRCLRCPLRAG